MSDSFPRVRSYVIRTARMSVAQKNAYSNFSSRWVIPHNEVPVDLSELFTGTQKYILEIGFGMGDATRRMAQEHPEWGILAVEVHKPGIGKLLWWIDRENLKNLYIIEGDAVEVLSDVIPEGSLDGIHIWFPDPWPKKKHHKRRLIQTDFALKIKMALKSGGYVHAATDWQPYADHILSVLTQTPGLSNRFESWAEKPDYRPETRFENRGIAARRIIRDIIFDKENP